MVQVACTMLPSRLFVCHLSNLSKAVFKGFPFLVKSKETNQVNVTNLEFVLSIHLIFPRGRK